MTSMLTESDPSIIGNNDRKSYNQFLEDQSEKLLLILNIGLLTDK